MKNEKNKLKIIVAVLSVLLVLSVIFIFSNSLKTSAQSNRESGRMARIIGPIIDAIFGEGRLDINYVVRKGAHFVEFAALGFFTYALSLSVMLYKNVKVPFCGIFGTLAVAVADEYIQLFTGRTSSVSDIIIDFSGAIFGMLAGFLICLLVRRIRKGKQ